MKSLTKAEEEIMQILWRLNKGFVRDIVDEFPDPKPAYNTVSTILRILVKKGIVAYNSFGKSHQYYPLIAKEKYSQKVLSNLVSNYFSGSYSQLVSFFAKQNNLSLAELEHLLNDLKTHKDD